MNREWKIRQRRFELAEHNISVNAVAPGGIATPGVAAMSHGASAEQMEASTKAFMAKIPMRRMGKPDEIGKVVLFLASDMSSYMTGEQIVVDGGALIKLAGYLATVISRVLILPSRNCMR